MTAHAFRMKLNSLLLFGLSIKQVSDVCSVSEQTVLRWVNADAVPTKAMRIAVIKMLEKVVKS